MSRSPSRPTAADKPKRPHSRTLAVGDVHGCLTPLVALAEAVPLRPSDTVVMLGDYSSRGPDSRGVHEWLCDRREVQRAGGGELITLRGNHEVMLLQSLKDPLAFRSWHSVGGRETLASYGRDDTDLREPDWLPDRHRRLLEDGLRPYFETQTHIFVHASLPTDVPPAEAADVFRYWEPFNADWPPHESGKPVVCGHAVQRSGLPAVCDWGVCIDTGCGFGGWLTCLDVESGAFWQASEDGDVRTMHL